MGLRSHLGFASGLVVMLVGCAGGDVPSSDVSDVAPRVGPQHAIGAAEHAPGFHAVAGGFAASARKLSAQTAGGDLFVRTPGGAAARLRARFDGATLGAATLDGNGALRVDRGIATERFAAAPSGIEHSLTFSAAPRAGGALDVHVELAGAACIEVDRAGARLSQGLRYGAATWIDAKGTATPVTERCESGGIALTLPAELLARSVYPATLDPMVSALVAIDVAAPGSPTTADPRAIAGDGTGEHLLVWTGASFGSHTYAGATLVQDDGTVTTTQLPITGDAPLIWTGQNYLACSITGCARYDAAGNAIGQSFAFDTAPVHGEDTPNIACMPTGCLAVFATYDSQTQVSGIAAFATDATGLPLAGPPVTSTGFSPGEMSFDGTNFVVFGGPVGGGPPALMYRLAPNGTPIEGAPITVDANATADGVACMGSTCLLLRDESVGPAKWQANVVRVQNGTILDTSPVAVLSATSAATVKLAQNGSNYLVTGFPFYGGGGSYVSLELAVVGANAQLVAPPQTLLELTTAQVGFVADGSPSGFFVSWGTADGLFGIRIKNDGSLGDANPFPIVAGTNADQTPAVAFDGAQYLVVWVDNRAGVDNIWGARVGLDGTPIDTTPFSIGSAPAAQAQPAAAFDGTNFVVAWSDTRDNPNGDLYAARVSQAGAVLDPQGIAVHTGGNDTFPSIAARPGGTVLVWSNSIPFGPDDEYGALLDTSGAVVAGPQKLFQVTTVEQFKTAANVGYDGTNFVVAFASDTAAKVARVDATLHLVGTSTLSASGLYGSPMGLVCGSGDCVVAWGLGELRAAHVASDGTVTPSGGEVVVKFGQAVAEWPAILFDGHHYVVTAASSYGYGVTAQFLDPTTLAPELPLNQPFLVTSEDYGPLAAQSSGNRDVFYAIVAKASLVEDYVMTQDPLGTSSSSAQSATATSGASTTGSSGHGGGSPAGGTGAGTTSTTSTGEGTRAGGTSSSGGASSAGGGGGNESNGGGCSCHTAPLNPTSHAGLCLLLVCVGIARRRARSRADERRA